METSETGLEKIIVKRFGRQNGYEQHLTVSGETLKRYFLPHFRVKFFADKGKGCTGIHTDAALS